MSIPPICLPNNKNLPINIDIKSPIVFQTYKVNGENDGNTDFMVLAEFSEIEGPIPLLVIPHNIKPFIEINELVMNLMSTDYHCRGSNEFRIWDSTSLTLLYHGLGQFICAQYFILYDIRARGFVRPMCIAYCSTSLQKILTYESDLEKEILQAMQYFKTSNLELFSHELESRIKDLLYTKKRLSMSNKHAKLKEKESIGRAVPSTSDSKLNVLSSHVERHDSQHGLQRADVTLGSSVSSCDSVPLASMMFDQFSEDIYDSDEDSVLQNVTKESLKTQIKDCQNIVRIVSDYLKSSTSRNELETLKSRISTPKCALHLLNSQEPSFEQKSYTPCVFAWSLMRRNYKNMRKIKDLCGLGYLAGLLKLLNVVDTYSKPFTDLFFRDLERRHGLIHSRIGTLQMGLVSCRDDSSQPLPTFSLLDNRYDRKLTQLLRSTEKSTTDLKDLIESYNSDITESLVDLVDIVDSKMSLRQVQLSDPMLNLPNTYSYVSERLRTNWDILLEGFGGTVRTILYSALCGKTVLVAGPEVMKNKVSAIIDVLSSVLPFSRKNICPVLRWHMGIVTKYHLSCYRIIGICIPERLHLHELMSNDTLNKVTVLNVETSRISGVAYYGKYLQQSHFVRTAKKLDAVQSMDNSCFQSLIQNTLIRVARDGFLLTQMLATTARSDDQILKGLGIHQGDWAPAKYISSLLRDN